MKLNKNDFKKAIREEIIEMLSGGDDSMTDQIYALISRANMSDDAKEVMMKWMEHTDNPQAIINYLKGTMNKATIEVKPEDTIRIVKEVDEDEIDKKAIKAASSGKKDSIISMANQLVKVATEMKSVVTEMKSLAKEYKSAKEGKETEKEKEILSKLKELTAQKKELTVQKRKLEAKLS